MKPTLVHRRGRALASLTTVMGLALGAAAVGNAPAQSAAPSPDCTPYSGTLAKGDAVTTKSVTSGTTPETFDGTVLGVLQDGIAPDLDMIMVEMTPPDPDRIGGIWQGMSGSPVYAANGEVIGAVAYGLSWGPSWIAGVTPFADMDDYLTAPAAPAKVKVSDAAARTIARNSDVTRAQAAEGFSQLPMPTGVSGVRSRRLVQADNHRAKHQWLPKSTYRMGAAAAAGDPGAAGPESIVPGGNLAASLSYGDVTQGGVGTVTAVCNDKVVGFGHPMTFLGRTSLTLHPADALFIQPESLGAPFKVANLGVPAGTISDDHLTGITGFLGAAPDTADVTSTVSYAGRARTGTTHVSVPQAMASTVFYESVGNHDRVVDGAVPGSELLAWTVTGHELDGTPFNLQVTDRFVSNYDITYEAAWDLADFVWSLSSIPGVTVDDVTMSSDVSDDSSVWEVARLEQRVAGRWVKAGRGAPVMATAGKALPLRAVLTSGSATRKVPVSVTVPANASGGEGRLYVTGGSNLWSRNAYPNSVKQAQKYADTMVRNDELQVDLALYSRRKGIRKSGTTDPQDKVVTGRKQVRVFVK
jgi:hypothetical protein